MYPLRLVQSNVSVSPAAIAFRSSVASHMIGATRIVNTVVVSPLSFDAVTVYSTLPALLELPSTGAPLMPPFCVLMLRPSGSAGAMAKALTVPLNSG